MLLHFHDRFDPGLLHDPRAFARKVAIVTGHVKDSGPNVTLPGEIELRRKAANEAKGTITVAQALHAKILELGAKRSRL